MKLIVRNLSRTTTEAEVRAMFEAYGAVQSCNLVMDKETGASKGFAFVEMVTEEAAQEARSALNGRMVDQREIKVDNAKPRPDRGSRPRW